MSSSNITSWQIDGETMETVTDFILGRSNSLQMVTATVKLTPWKKSYDHPRQYIKKQRLFFLPTKVRLVKAMVFPVVMYGCESWTIKKAEHRGIDAFEL